MNLVQISATGMELDGLKQEIGKDLVVWGGGVGTPAVLGPVSPDEIRDHLRKNIDALAPGGGFAFAAVHDVQASASPENITDMWEAWWESGAY